MYSALDTCVRYALITINKGNLKTRFSDVFRWYRNSDVVMVPLLLPQTTFSTAFSTKNLFFICNFRQALGWDSRR